MIEIFILLVILFLTLTSCDNTLSKNDELRLKELIKNTEAIDYSSNYYFKESNESNPIRYKALKSNSKYELSFEIDNKTVNYSFDINEGDLSVDNTIISKKDFKTIDDFTLYVFNENFEEAIVASYSDFLSLIKEVFNSSNEIRKGRSLNNDSMKNSFYYSINFSEELLINSTCYEKFKLFADTFVENEEDSLELSIVASLTNNIIYPIIEISNNQEILFYL